MKKVIMLLCLLAAISAGAQDTINNFHINDNAIVWSKKYPCSKSIKEVYFLLKSSGEFVSIDTLGSKIFGELRQFDADYKGAGYALMLTPIYILSSHINGFVVMNIKDSIFEVEIKKIVLEQSYSAGRPGDLLSSEKGEKTELETYAINKNKHRLRDMFKDGAKILDYSFNKKFQSLIK
jgi:hypothetical protein